jgi:hypothetical protein
MVTSLGLSWVSLARSMVIFQVEIQYKLTGSVLVGAVKDLHKQSKQKGISFLRHLRSIKDRK